ncbi:hypothetical protein QUB28_14205 [Microcoleus sp. B4-C3]
MAGTTFEIPGNKLETEHRFTQKKISFPATPLAVQSDRTTGS